MIRSLAEDQLESAAPGSLRPTPDMLERRRRLLDETFGMWDTPEGEKISDWLHDAFRLPDPQPEMSANDR